jgi:hypothetical protein
LTHVFYHEKKANQFIQEINWPVVAKSNIGASASGVKILKSLMEAEEYIASAFGKGVKREVGPKWRKLKFTRVIQLLTTPSIIFKRLKHYQNIQSDVQKGFVILQDYVSHDFEWRVVRIGDSFFAHKKLKVGELASGSLLKNYDNPPLSLFDFVQDMTSKFELHSVAVDIFESGNGNYLVNEVQCIFGQSDQYQMMVDGKVGRYVRQNNEWVFEEGDFNGNQCYDLRLEWVIKECRNESTLR